MTEKISQYASMSMIGLISVQANPERRAAVLDAQLAAEEVQEQVAVAEEIDVDAHGLPV